MLERDWLSVDLLLPFTGHTIGCDWLTWFIFGCSWLVGCETLCEWLLLSGRLELLFANLPGASEKESCRFLPDIMLDIIFTHSQSWYNSVRTH